MDAEAMGRDSLLLDSGRHIADAIDFSVGLSGIKKIGERVEKGEPLLSLHACTDQALRLVLPLLEKAIEIS
jgi:thymidine phosphorylase